MYENIPKKKNVLMEMSHIQKEMYKVVVSDLDGTLLNSDQEVSELSKKVIRELHNRGKYHFEKSSAKGKANAMEAGAEYRYEVTPGLELGGGVAYQAHKDLKEYKADMYDSVPVYATAKYTFDTSAPVKPYVKGDLGYSINTDKAKDGVYYGVGAGLNISDNFNVDVMYKENKGKYEVGTTDYKADYRRVALGVGYNFNLGK